MSPFSIKKSLALIAGVVILAMVMYACGSSTTPATPTSVQPTLQAPTLAQSASPTVPTDSATAQATITEAASEGAITEQPGSTQAATSPGSATLTSSGVMIVVSNQAIGQDNSLMISKVRATQPGWVVIYGDTDGQPGEVVGWAPVRQGENDQIKLTLTGTSVQSAVSGGMLWAVLHVDMGAPGTFEFPGVDAPLKDASGNLVMTSFRVTH